MGFVRSKLTIINLTRSKRAELNFLVDTGSRYTVIPPAIAERLGIKPLLRTRVITVDKREVETNIGVAFLAALGREAPVFVAILESPEPLLGTEALEALGFSVDPTTGELKPTRPYAEYLLRVSKKPSSQSE